MLNASQAHEPMDDRYSSRGERDPYEERGREVLRDRAGVRTAMV